MWSLSDALRRRANAALSCWKRTRGWCNGRARVARENSDEQGCVCLLPSQLVAVWVALTVFTKSAMTFSMGWNPEVGLRLFRRFSRGRGSRCLSSQRNCRGTNIKTHPLGTTVRSLRRFEQMRTINILIYAGWPAPGKCWAAWIWCSDLALVLLKMTLSAPLSWFPALGWQSVVGFAQQIFRRRDLWVGSANCVVLQCVSLLI